MRLVLISDTFFPLRTSGAIQIHDLAHALVRRGHEVLVMVPGHDLKAPWAIETIGKITVLRLRAPKTKDLPYLRRLLAEWWMPYSMYRNWRRSPLSQLIFDGVVFYSPSIFHTPLVNAIRRKHSARSYLILRDIFPDWALDMKLIKPGVVYAALKSLAKRQYRAADVIGVQSPGNLALLPQQKGWGRREVLHNWLEARPDAGCEIDLSETTLAGRTICVYAGNIGVAQKLDVLIDTAEALRTRTDIGFVLVGRGNDASRIATDIARRGLDNVLMFDEIAPEDVPGLYSQCDIGLVVLDERHRTHNIPGKFVSYMHAGLPVLAVINPDNDLIEMIESASVGVALHDRTTTVVVKQLTDLVDRLKGAETLSASCKELASRHFTADRAAAQIIEGLESDARLD